VLNVPNNYLFLNNGSGLYSTVVIGDSSNEYRNSSVTLDFIDNSSAEISIGKSLLDFDNVSKIQVVDTSGIAVHAKQPTIHITNGNLSLEELYSRGQLYDRTGALGDDLKVLGNMTLSLYMSDSYTLADQIFIDGFTQRVPLYEYDEAISFLSYSAFSQLFGIPPFVLGIFSAPFLLSAILLVYDRLKISNKRRSS